MGFSLMNIHGNTITGSSEGIRTLIPTIYLRREIHIYGAKRVWIDGFSDIILRLKKCRSIDIKNLFHSKIKIS